VSRSATWVAALGLLLTADIASSEILHVSHRPAVFDPSRAESVEVRFHLSQPAEVELTLFDARDLAIRTLRSPSALAVGDHIITWDGRDERGNLVPPEAYTYALEARGAKGEVSRWDVSKFGGEPVEVGGLAWDPQAGQMRYQLPVLARVCIRIGLADGGPLLRTVIDWVPRVAGPHAEPWDGRDASGVLALSQHPALFLNAKAFALPRNSILVGPPSDRSAFVDGLPPDARRHLETAVSTHRMFDYAHQSVEERSDFLVKLSLPENLERTAEGVPIVREPVPVRIDVADAAFARAVNERSENVFYVDGLFVFERESGFLPMTWKWDPTGHAPGLHHLTANIRGYEGHFGIGTVPVWVEAPASHTKP
jgi:hypothetical protein